VSRNCCTWFGSTNLKKEEPYNYQQTDGSEADQSRYLAAKAEQQLDYRAFAKLNPEQVAKFSFSFISPHYVVTGLLPFQRQNI
jgi:hypothetical protein